MILRKRFRFDVVNAVTSASITIADLIGLISVGGSVSTQVVSLIASLRVRKVSIWGPVAAQGQSVAVSCQWVGGQFAKNSTKMDQTNSVTAPAYISTKPPKMSQASFWVSASSTASSLALISCPGGSVVDVDLDLVVNNGTVAPASYTVTGPATSAVVYFQYLDGASTHNFVPQGVLSIF